MCSAEDLFAEGDINNDLIQEDTNNDNSGNEPENENDSGNEQEETEVKSDDQEKKVVKPKRVVRNPQPKLNVDTLKGPKGLLCLEGYFKSKKYKGRGHEQQDLRTILKTYEYWCHRLFPKLPFDDCLAKIESLGTKKPMQTYLKRIRMGLILDEEEKPIQSDNEENQATHDQFDELVPQAFDVTTSQTVQDDDQQLTEEQLERIRLNKERADRLRQEKLQRRKDALAGASQTGDFVAEAEEQSEKNEETAEQYQETLERNELHESDFVVEETVEVVTNTMEIDLEGQNDNIETGNSSNTFDVEDERQSLQNDSVEENVEPEDSTSRHKSIQESKIIVAQCNNEIEEPMDYSP